MQGKIIGIALIGLLAVGGVLYFTSQDSQERELFEVIGNMQELESYTMEFDIDVEGAQNGEDMGRFSLSGVMNNNALEEKSKGDISFDGNINEMGVSIGLSLNFSTITVDEVLYLKLENLPEMLTMFIPQETKEKIVGQWIALSRDEIMQESEIEDIDEEKLEKALEKLLERFLRRNIIVVVDEEKDNLDGIAMSKYEIAFDSKALIEFIENDFQEFALEMGIEEVEDVWENEEERKEVISMIEKAQENMEAYIWTDGKYIHQASLNFTFSSHEEEEEDEGEELEFNVFVMLRFKNFNEKFEINPPEEFISGEEIMGLFDTPALFPDQMQDVDAPTSSFPETIDVEDIDWEDYFPEGVDIENMNPDDFVF